MNQAERDARALQMWLVASPFVLQPMPFPQISNPLTPFLIGQLNGDTAPIIHQKNRMDGRKRKRKSQEKAHKIAEKDLNAANDTDDTTVRHNKTLNSTGDGSSETVEAVDSQPSNNIHPAFKPNKTSTMDGFSAMFSRNTCRHCGKFFRNCQLLRQHMLVHTDQRKYQCQYCERTFKQLSHLQQHHRIHTGKFFYLIRSVRKWSVTCENDRQR